FSASMFNFVNFHVLSDASGQSNVLGIGSVGFDDTNYAFAVDVQKNDATEGHAFRITLDGGAFDETFQERIEHYVTNIIVEMTQNSRAPIDRTRLLGAEFGQLLREFNATQASYPP